jgi:hypothetical protein
MLSSYTKSPLSGQRNCSCYKHGPNDLKPAPCPEWLIQHLTKKDDQLDAVPPAPPKPLVNGEDGLSPYHRSQLYLAKCEPAVSGQGGHAQTFKLACKLVKGFGLSEEQAFELLWSYFNPRCLPPWTEKELRQKVADAMKAQGETGFLLTQNTTTNTPPPTIGPAAVVRTFHAVELVVQKAMTEFSEGERADVAWIQTEAIDLAKEIVIAAGFRDDSSRRTRSSR